MNNLKVGLVRKGNRAIPFRKNGSTAPRCVYNGPPQAELSVLVVEPNAKVRDCFMQFIKGKMVACNEVVIVSDKVTALSHVNSGFYGAVVTNILMRDSDDRQSIAIAGQGRVFGRYMARHSPKSTLLHYVLGELPQSSRRFIDDLCPSDTDTVAFTTNSHLVSPEVDLFGIPTSDGCLALFRCLFLMHELRMSMADLTGPESQLRGYRFGDEGWNCRFVLQNKPDTFTRLVFKKYHILF